VILVAIVALVVGLVAWHFSNRPNTSYPNYYPLNYTLSKEYSGVDFFDNFDYYNGSDPTYGFSTYLPQANAEYINLTFASSSSAIIRVDSVNVYDVNYNGRDTVRLESKDQFNSGLFLLDVSHIPYGCGVWPSFWLANLVNWPAGGEIDIIEGVNSPSTDEMTLHTTDGCSMANIVRNQTNASILTTDCYNATDDNSGCGVQSTDTSYGAAWNAAGGGVYAMELRTEGIRIWHFLRPNIPSNVNSSTPDPSTWGPANADFPNTSCNIPSHFWNLTMIFDIDFCGAWAGQTSVWASSNCSTSLTCAQYVGQNPSAYTDTYFDINYVRIFQA